MSDDKKAFYEYNACIMEPWDGPALFRLLMEMWCTFDRNGLRPLSLLPKMGL
jgi:glutamate synthase (ferredoxin)